MRYVQFTLISLCIVLAASTAMVKSKKAEKSMDSTMMESYTKLAAPIKQHKQLARLARSWTTKTKERIEPNKPSVELSGLNHLLKHCILVPN
jgi:hypothetical protein